MHWQSLSICGSITIRFSTPAWEKGLEKGLENHRDKNSSFRAAFAGWGDVGGRARGERFGDPGWGDGGLGMDGGGGLGFARVTFLDKGDR